MKQLKLLFIVLIAININSSCTAKSKSDQKEQSLDKAEKVEVFYFHYTRRCATCNEVKDVAKAAILEFYENKVFFFSYNLDEEEGKQKAKEIGVSGQTLIIVSGENNFNITNEGFMNARTNPEKLKEIIKEKIDPLV